MPRRRGGCHYDLGRGRGNTNIVLGIYGGRTLTHHWRLEHESLRYGGRIWHFDHNLFQLAGVRAEQIEGVILSCVVPPIMNTLEQLFIKYVGKEALVVGPGIKTGLNIRYENPARGRGGPYRKCGCGH